MYVVIHLISYILFSGDLPCQLKGCGDKNPPFNCFRCPMSNVELSIDERYTCTDIAFADISLDA